MGNNKHPIRLDTGLVRMVHSTSSQPRWPIRAATFAWPPIRREQSARE